MVRRKKYPVKPKLGGPKSRPQKYIETYHVRSMSDEEFKNSPNNMFQNAYLKLSIEHEREERKSWNRLMGIFWGLIILGVLITLWAVGAH